MFCSKCGKELEKGAIFCDGCRVLIRIPKGLNVASIILIFLSALSIFCGILLIIATYIPTLLDELLKLKTFEDLAKETFTKFGLIIGISILLFSVLYLIVGLGLRRLKRWAAVLGVILCILNLVLGYKNIFSNLINVLIIIFIVGNWRYLSEFSRRSNP